MTSQELKENKEALLQELEGIDALSKEEKRDLTEDEETRSDEIVSEVEALDSKIAKAEKREAALANKAKAKVQKNEQTEKEEIKKDFSLTRAINQIVEDKQLSGVEAEMFQEARKEARSFGSDVTGNIAVPSWIANKEERATVDQSNSAIQPVEVGAFVDALREGAVWEKVGASVHNGLTADYKIPVVGAQSLAWATAENSAAGDGGAQFTSVTLNPTRLTGYVDISRRILLQNGQGAVTSVMRDLGRESANKISDAMFSTADVSNAPGSIGGTSNVGTFTEATYSANASILSDLVEAEQTLADAEGLQGNLAYVLSTKLLNDLKKSAQVASVIPAMTSQNRNEANINGYMTCFTTSCTDATGSADGYFGDFSHLHVGFFGGIDMTVDPWSALLNDEVRIVVHNNVDWALTQPAAFVKFTSLTA